MTVGQYMTPLWAAEALIERYFPGLSASDLVLEPTCGTGSFLAALPRHVPALGVELDAELARQAAARTGRQVVTGDIRTVPLDVTPTVAVGNPPFSVPLIEAVLDRCAELLPRDGVAGFLLPAYMMQTPRRVLRYAREWGIRTEVIPRTLFPRLSKPLVFALFERGRAGTLVGLALYAAADDVASLRQRYRQLLADAAGSAWRTTVIEALIRCGGEATLQALYDEIGPRRPTDNQWWREKVRQTVQRECRRVGPGRYALAARDATYPLEGVA